jgi:hypothetical protein
VSIFSGSFWVPGTAAEPAVAAVTVLGGSVSTISTLVTPGMRCSAVRTRPRSVVPIALAGTRTTPLSTLSAGARIPSVCSSTAVA